MIAAAYSKIKDTKKHETLVGKIGFYNEKAQDTTVRKKAESMLNVILNKISLPNPDDNFYASFKMISGGVPEPKTDILFQNGNKKYKCSLKWGSSYQLSSAGIEGTVTVLNKILYKTAIAGNMTNQSVLKVAAVLDELYNDLGPLRTEDRSIITGQIAKANKPGGVTSRLQEILGSRGNPISEDAALQTFKREVIREALTGKTMFGDTDKTAEYLLSDTEFRLIDDILIDNLMSKTYVSLRLKSRSKNNVRLNEISIRIEPKR